ncbi:MAG: ABC-F family ATP-binding cassette domain-containing protein [Verrucomicrobia bacterium]|nr:ABC-F family ATP-binding cassette domain-containing protein [Verrucomicrobiota bacterium]
MIQAEGIFLAYGTQIVLEGAGFTLQKGERCGLIGRNGSGKSTLFRLLAGKEKADRGTIVSPKGYRIGVLEQQIRFSKPTILEEAALGLPEDEKDCLYKAERLLFGLGFSEEQMDSSPDSLSGGYQLRVQLAKVLVSEPDCLLLDEPTNYLDILSVRFLTQFLKEWKGEMILISHDLQFLDDVTNQMMAIHRQKIHKLKGKSSDMFQMIALEEETYEQTRQNIEKKRAHMQSYVDRFGAKASKATQAQSKKKMIDKLPTLEKLKGLHDLDFSFHEVPFMGKKMIDAAQLQFSYDPEKPLIDDFSLIIENKDRIAIIGKNGYGKSTLLKLLVQEVTPQKGNLTTSQALRIGYFGQTSIDRLDSKLRVEEEISSANTNLNFTQVRGICGVMMFSGDLAKKSISVLSGGEKSRVLLGKILAQPCNLLLLDEPTHHLDIESIEALIDAIETFSGSVVIVTHSEWMLRRIPFNKLVVCHKQKQELFSGTYDEFLEQVGWQEEKPVSKKSESSKSSCKPKVNMFQVKACEDQIEKLEMSLEQKNLQLADPSQAGKGDQIKKLLQEIEEGQKQLDELYNRLAALYNQS